MMERFRYVTRFRIALTPCFCSGSGFRSFTHSILVIRINFVTLKSPPRFTGEETKPDDQNIFKVTFTWGKLASSKSWEIARLSSSFLHKVSKL